MIDCPHATRVHGVVCSTGMLSNQWTLPDFYPTGDIPNGVRLTGFSGEASNLPSDVLQTYLDDVVAGNAIVPVGKVFNIDQIQDAHRAMEDHTAKGKIVATRMLRGESPP